MTLINVSILLLERCFFQPTSSQILEETFEYLRAVPRRVPWSINYGQTCGTAYYYEKEEHALSRECPYCMHTSVPLVCTRMFDLFDYIA